MLTLPTLCKPSLHHANARIAMLALPTLYSPHHANAPCTMLTLLAPGAPGGPTPRSRSQHHANAPETSCCSLQLVTLPTPCYCIPHRALAPDPRGPQEAVHHADASCTMLTLPAPCRGAREALHHASAPSPRGPREALHHAHAPYTMLALLAHGSPRRP